MSHVLAPTSLCHAGTAHTLPTTPQEWDRLNDTLARYGYSVLRAWIGDGTVFSRIDALLHIRLAPSMDLRDDPDAAAELAGLTVAVAIPAFRDQLEHGSSWDPRRGASLRTYFIGQCLMRFPNEYRRWLREHRAGACLTPAAVHTPDLPDPHPGPDQAVALHLDALSVLAKAPVRTRTALAHVAVGYSHREVASRLNTTPKSVEMLLRRHRKRTPADPHC
ncbi:RNA polymerase sigma factor [Streptomyces sp. NPDC050658]|uniref:RNA polymerase sigma factor n=1 Tax=unclassified Streptomyces TaxID=2593676 RepID=UPI003422C9BA